MTDTYDLIAIGSGPAGESATEPASFFGDRTVRTTGGAPTKTTTRDVCELLDASGYVTVRRGDAASRVVPAKGLDHEVGRADLARTRFLKQDRRHVGVHCIGDICFRNPRDRKDCNPMRQDHEHHREYVARHPDV